MVLYTKYIPSKRLTVVRVFPIKKTAAEDIWCQQDKVTKQSGVEVNQSCDIKRLVEMTQLL